MILSATEETAISVFEDNILLGGDLRINYDGKIQKDLCCMLPGYSFLSDQCNPFHTFNTALLDVILADPSLMDRPALSV